MNKKKKTNVINIIVILLCVAIVLAGGYYVYNYLYLPSTKVPESDSIVSEYVSPGQIKSIVPIKDYEKEFYGLDSMNKLSMSDIEKMSLDTNLDIRIGELLENSNELYSKNNDYRAWLIVPGGEVNYPVMKTKDNYKYYLYRDFNKEYSFMGSLFFGDGVDESSEVSIIHGHNMKNDKMFGALENYKDKNVYEKYPRFAIVTTKEVILYDIIASIYTYIPKKGSTDFKYFDYCGDLTKKDKKKLVKWINKNRLYECRYEANKDDRLMILSTCSYQVDDGRFLLIAKRIN